MKTLLPSTSFELQFPNTSHTDAYTEMIEEWKQSEVTPTSPRRLFVGESYEEFLQKVRQDVVASERGVNSSLFFLVGDRKILGAIQIRHHINHPDLKESGGHIGYGIRPSERGKGYAKIMLSLALEKAKDLGLTRVMLSCDDDNIPSSRVIEANGGIFDAYLIKDGVKLRRYWIELKS